MESEVIAIIESYLDALLVNKPIVPQEMPEAWQGVQDRFADLSKKVQDLKAFAVSLSSGDMQADPPPRSNYMAAGLKQLQAQMRHLTWQAQCVARGDYNQRIDFMGDFSAAFNEMVKQLQSRESGLRDTREAMVNIFNLIEPIIVVSTQEPDFILYANDMATERFGLKNGKQPLTPLQSSLLALPPSGVQHQIEDAPNARWYSVLAHTLHWGDQHNAILYYCQDITAHKERENTLDLVANTDELTGIHNRRAFDHSFIKLWQACAASSKPISIVMFDLDYFKNFNDTYGHMAGDVILAEFAKILSQCIGRRDDLVARYGGEEFVAAIPFAGEETAIRMATSVRDTLAAHQISITDGNGNPHSISITVSAGVSSIIPMKNIAPARLIVAADHAMYQAKAAGRNRVRYQSLRELPDGPK